MGTLLNLAYVVLRLNLSILSYRPIMKLTEMLISIDCYLKGHELSPSSVSECQVKGLFYQEEQHRSIAGHWNRTLVLMAYTSLQKYLAMAKVINIYRTLNNGVWL